jgi:hypothetical protein
MEKFARKCSKSGVGMNEGWVIGDGENYAATEEVALEYAKEMGYSSIKKAYNDDAMYWTSWEDEDEWEYVMIDGELYEIESDEYYAKCAEMWMQSNDIPFEYVGDKLNIILNEFLFELSDVEVKNRAELFLENQETE